MSQPTSQTAARRRKPHAAANHERWLVSYADFMTLLFALFVVLFASSHHNKQTIRQVSASVKNGFREMSGFTQIASCTSPEPCHPSPSAEDPPLAAPPLPLPTHEAIELQGKLRGALGKQIEQQQVGLRMTPEGFVLSLHELGFFASGQAQLLPEAAATVRRIAAILTQYGLDMRIEGHSDNVPIHNAAFASNWDLSTARATTVAMMLLNNPALDPARLSIAGYGQYHPATPNTTPEGRRANRRVDIVVVGINKLTR